MAATKRNQTQAAGRNGGRKGQAPPRLVTGPLGKALIAALTADFQAKGSVAVERFREGNPSDYVRLVAALLPREAAQAVGHKAMKAAPVVTEIEQVFSAP